jgi:hypothetical protein
MKEVELTNRSNNSDKDYKLNNTITIGGEEEEKEDIPLPNFPKL